MKLMNSRHPVKASWIREMAYRLDARPFISGALEARKTLEGLGAKKDQLITLTRDGMKGIYHAGREGRTWVDDPNHGVPFLSSTDILNADLSTLSLMAKRQVKKKPQFVIHEGWTLITRSGTIGRTVYARSEMDGMACSEHVMRVVPDESLVPSGYLYAFVSSKYGIPIVVSGTYGSIIQSIEPEHIATLPVPRFGKSTEHRVHELITRAAELRCRAGAVRQELVNAVESFIGWERRTLRSVFTKTSALKLTRRMDAFHHSSAVQAARHSLASHKDAVALGDHVEDVFEPNRGARMKVDDQAFGIPFLSSSAVFRLEPAAEYLISNRTPHLEKLILTDRDVLLPRSGQLGGIIGRSVLPLPTNYGWAASEHLVRVRCHTHEDALYLWAIFATQPGYYAAIATAFGTSIPSLDCGLIADLMVPWSKHSIRQKFVSAAREIVDCLDEALHAEREGISLVEQAIEENA
ncbi:hypothetical protein Pan97_39010 [Bremerella volcania]|uniref:EcoKI restriction-modification system protein HsdS n=1 Tax=Bremerella volcania TaxID=2527984 RepID=A0A518CCC2_9BACT|nr:restriction endonuclease subunit S [Bremerella volcania]QDU76844.1 hypothetical protein Pan97_39010 [Bremerella volcania]